MLVPEKECHYPNLRTEGYSVTSPETTDVTKPRYNCVGWAVMGDADIWWQPGSFTAHFWPKGVLDDGTFESYINLFEHLGYSPCSSPSIEIFYEKVALYAFPDGEFAHVSYQLFYGWTSKLGEWEDIYHRTVTGLVGEYYGDVKVIMKRRSNLRGFLSRAFFRWTNRVWPIDRARFE